MYSYTLMIVMCTLVSFNANDLRSIFNRSYISTKRVYIKVPPVAQQSSSKVVMA